MAIQSNKEYLTKTLSRFNLTEDGIDLILAKYPGFEETNFNVLICKDAIYKSMSEILPTVSILEGGSSLSWNMSALGIRYNTLCKELGKGNILGGRPKVRSRGNS